MDIKKKMQDELNKQIAHELYAEHLYLSMCAYFEDLNLKGFANWMRKQAEEERVHGMKIFDYINSRNGRVYLDKIDKPKSEWKGPLQAAQDALAHERKVTGLINNLMKAAEKENDYATQVFLHWFVNEQVEEEDSATYLVEQLQRVGNSRSALLLLDNELTQRKE